MTTPQTMLGVKEWLKHYAQVFIETIEASLNLPAPEQVNMERDYPVSNVMGAYMPLLCAEEEIIVGLISDPQTCQMLAKKFIQADDTEVLPNEDMADAVKEIVNVTAGLLKSQLTSSKISIKLGLPFFLEGHIKLTESQESACSQMILAGAEIFLIVIRTSPHVLELIETGPAVPQRTPEEWLSESLTAAFMLTINHLGMEKYQVKKIVKSFPENDIAGAYMPLIGDDDAVLIGLLSNPAGLESLARTFLQMTPAEPVEWAMVVDSVKEILNVLSGMVKQQLFKQNTTFKISLPFFVDGYIEVTENQEAVAAVIDMGTTLTYLVVIKKKNENIIPA
jgi:CheY-specific phosphatase CheX